MSSATRSSIRRIRMGDVTIGMVGLDEIFIALHSEGYTPDETAIPELLTRVGQYNFIAASAEDEYAEMLLREFRTFCQQREAGNHRFHLEKPGIDRISDIVKTAIPIGVRIVSAAEHKQGTIGDDLVDDLLRPGGVAVAPANQTGVAQEGKAKIGRAGWWGGT